MTIAPHEGSSGTESAGRAVDILLAFLGPSETLGVSELARDLGMSKAVVHRALQTLLSRELLQLDPETRRYRLGESAAALGARAFRGSDLRKAAADALQRLYRLTGETVTLSGLVPGGRVYLDNLVSAHEISVTLEIGRRFPLHAGSSGKCMLAAMPLDVQDDIIGDDLERLTDRTVTDPGALKSELRHIREVGYAVSSGERLLDASSVAAAVRGFDGEVRGAISVCGPIQRVTPEVIAQFAPQVVEAAHAVSLALGYRPPHPA